ncbi:MAG: haloacid dehalogenase-like hydrolase [Synergistaceae bacterium]|nr:haloacid dehalogenase-like hydrolase [Synergistaceae bacterium]
MSEEKIALFDFCDTMINFQSADNYVRYVKAHVHSTARMRMLEGLRKFLVKVRLMRILQVFSREGYVNKRMLLRQLEGLSEQEMTNLAESFYRELVRPNYVPEVIAEVMRLRQEGYRLFIVSGGYDVYLRYVAEEFGFEDCIATRLDFQDGRFTGRYRGDDCMKENKVKLLREYFGRESLRDCDSVAYSDSKSDIPLLKFCRKGVAVTRKNCPPPPVRILCNRDWISANGFEVLSWEN